MTIEEIANLEREGRRSIREALRRHMTAEGFAEEAAEENTDILIKFVQELARYMGLEVVNKIGMNTVTAPFLAAAFLLEAAAVIEVASKGNPEVEQDMRDTAEGISRAIHAGSAFVTMRVRDDRM
jgi:DNA-binding GntR family transcriptional regulator